MGFASKTPYDAEKAKKLIVDKGHGIHEVKGVLEGDFVIHLELADTEYAGWWNCGSENNGYFAVVGFQKGLDVVSLKSIDP